MFHYYFPTSGNYGNIQYDGVIFCSRLYFSRKSLAGVLYSMWMSIFRLCFDWLLWILTAVVRGKSQNKTIKPTVLISPVCFLFFLIPEICLKEKYTLDELDVLDILYINLYNYHDSQLCSRFILQSSTVLTFSRLKYFSSPCCPILTNMSVGSYMVQQKSPITQRSKKRAKLLVLSGKEGWHLFLSSVSQKWHYPIM